MAACLEDQGDLAKKNKAKITSSLRTLQRDFSTKHPGLLWLLVDLITFLVQHYLIFSMSEKEVDH